MFQDWLKELIKQNTDLPEMTPFIISGIPAFAVNYTIDQLGEAFDRPVKVSLFRNIDIYDEWRELIESGDVKATEAPVKIIQELPFDSNSLVGMGYSRVGRVVEPGEYSMYGDVMVLWIFGWPNPIRVSYFGDEVESITVVDKDSLRKRDELSSLVVNSENKDSEASSLISDTYVGNAAGEGELLECIYIRNAVSKQFDQPVLDLGITTLPMESSVAHQANVLRHLLEQYKSRGYAINYITASVERYKDSDWVESELVDNVVSVVKDLGQSVVPFSRGLVIDSQKIIYITDYELFGELNLSDEQLFEGVGNRLAMRDDLITRDEIFKRILPGDYIVHEDHGVGEYVGLVDRGGVTYLELSYAGKDKLFVPVSQSKKITKYIGSGNRKPVLTPLNSGAWRRVKNRVNEDAEALAKELVQLYAMRSVVNVDSGIRNSDQLNEVDQFIRTFEYDDTPDQMAATFEIIKDLQGEFPMDRLIVGDVGFGKTEIAVRAIYAVVNSGSQVAVLAPTTILVEQHGALLRKRFEGLGINVATMSRFLSPKELSTIAKKLEDGEVDVVVGTHALLSDSITFDNLGLIVVDEEQKFGVAQKEKLKKSRVEAHVLSLSATPIPRTLNMSLSGIRDISIVATPPEGRKPIANKFAKIDWNNVKEALSKEIDRGGQAYFLHNRVANIDVIRKKIARLLPGKRVERVHGQLSDDEISLIMSEFAEGNIDVLVCTTIIENGIDLPNVNTLIVNDAQNFGLSQLYQIRGRIGRSPRQAYAYFYFNTLKGLSGQRMEALAQSEALGSGFLLSSRDLEIRGAGNLLGKSQSGSINSVGYGLFISLLQDKIEEMKGDISKR